MSWVSGALAPLRDPQRRLALDGIRALAVLFVIAGHAAPDWLPGGALGVDVFFVLSGYLITAILLAHGTRAADLVTFWAGRARRLVPALVVMLTVTVTVAGAVRPGDLWLRWQHDVWSAVTYVLNWRLIATGDDYDLLVHGQAPHAHLWSLSVEEQFYLIWPLVLLIPWVRRHPARAITALLVGSVLTLLVLAGTTERVDRILWGTDARATQLLAGAALCVFAAHWRKVSARTASLVGVLGAVSLFGLAVIPAPDTPKGAALVFAAVAAASSALIVGVDSGCTTGLRRILTWTPLVYLGLISYAIYLWHLPVLWWWTHVAPNSGSGELAAFVVTLVGSVLLASASWFLLEGPLRRVRITGTPQHRLRRPIMVLAGAVLLLAGTGSYAGIVLAPQNTYQDMADSSGEFDCPEGSPVCTYQASGMPDDWVCERIPCVIYQPPSEPAAVVMLGGDSVARSLAPGIIELARERQWLLVAAAEGCSFIADQRVRSRTPPDPDPGTLHCIGLEGNLQAFARTQPVDLYIGFLGVSKAGLMQDGQMILANDPAYPELLATSVNTGAHMLAGIADRVLLIAPPQPTWSTDCAQGRDPDESGCAATEIAEFITHAERQAVLAQEGRVPRVSIFDSDLVFCPRTGERCAPGPEGEPWRYDGQHLTLAGSRALARGLLPVLDDLVAAATN